MSDFLDNLSKFYELAMGTSFEPYAKKLFILGILFSCVYFTFLGCNKLLNFISQYWFVKNRIYFNLSFIESSDVYYAIRKFIPTRFSSVNDPGYDDEPAPVYIDTKNEKSPLLIERFIRYEFDVKYGKKYYLCLEDCGMGKTTFLINLYYQIQKKHKYKSQLICLQDPSCLKQISDIVDKGNTILLLDALDENEEALTNYNSFIKELEGITRNFYRVIITARTNFFENESKEFLSEQAKAYGITSKLPNLQKFYITPFTDEDIHRFLALRYRFNRKKEMQLQE